MFPLVFLALIFIPIVEITIFIKVGGLIGFLPSVALILVISIFGTYLLRRQGLQTLIRAQSAMSRGEVPMGEMLDGFLLAFAALLLVVPGLLTDALGFALLVPPIRHGVAILLRRWLKTQNIQTQFFQATPNPDQRTQWNPQASWNPQESWNPEGGPIIEGEATEVEDPPSTRPTLPPRV